jgi:hypothetical protein
VPPAPLSAGAPVAEPTEHAISAAKRACAEIPRLTLVFTVDGGCPDLAAIVVPPSLPAPPVLTRAYPGAAVIVAGAGRHSGSDG